MAPTSLETDRLLLRPWIDSDLEPFAQLNADPEVMRYFPAVLSTEESNALAQKIQTKINDQGWGFWALVLKETEQFIGFLGLNVPAYEIPASPCVEIGWRMAQQFWGNGYATEAGRRVLDFAFETLELEKVVSFTAMPNLRSQRVMQRIGMQNTGENFDHPLVAIGHPLREHVLYSIERSLEKVKQQ